MKHKTLILSALAGVLAISTGAQDKPKVIPQRLQLQVRPAGGALLVRPGILQRGVQLNLTEAQQQQIAALRKDYSAARRELTQNRELSAQDRRDQMRDLSTDLQEGIKAVYLQNGILERFGKSPALRFRPRNKDFHNRCTYS